MVAQNTVLNADRYIEYNPTSPTTTFAVPFPIWAGTLAEAETHLIVTVDGVLQPTSAYSVTGTLNTDATPNVILDGNVVLGVAVDDVKVEVEGAWNPYRTFQFPDAQGVPPRHLNAILNAVTAGQREAGAASRRAILLPYGETAQRLPDAAARAQKLLGFDSLGNVVALPNDMTTAITSPITLAEVATPATPPDGFGKIYFKADGDLYALNDAGEEINLSAAGGSGLSVADFGITAAGNPNAHTLFNTMADALNALGITQIICDEAIVVSGTVDQAKIADITFIGRGSIKTSSGAQGIYRKWVIPPDAPSPAVETSLHPFQVPRLGGSYTPTVVLVGDSISTYLANSNARQDLVVEALRREINTRFADRAVSFFDRSIGGQVYGSFLSTGAYSASIDWWTNPAVTWGNNVKALNPDLIIFAFGMNDSSLASITALVAIVADVQSWAKVPDIVFMTNLTPCMSYPGEATQANQDGRDAAAGMTRTYADFYGFGLIDAHRLECMVRDGFDPRASIVEPLENIPAVITAGADTTSCTKKCNDYKTKFSFNGAGLVSGSASDFLWVKVGPGASDILWIDNNGGNYRFKLYAGVPGDQLAAYVSVTTALAVGGGTESFVVEKYDNMVTVYRDAAGFGTYTEPVFSSKLIARGGLFTPSVLSTGLVELAGNVTFWPSKPRLYMPSVPDGKLWGSTNYPNNGGSGWNHPSSYAASHIFRPLIRAANWRGRRYIEYVETAYDPASIAANTTLPKALVIPGVKFGDKVKVGTSINLATVTVTGCVASAGNVNLFYANNSAAAIDLASHTLRVEVEQY